MVMLEVEVIHSWSVPRSLSTCLMYSFAQRDDIEVLDEPLYVPYLRLNGGAKRPYREELLSTMENDGDKVMKEAIFAPGKKPYRYCKHIAKQCLPGVKVDLLKKGKHFILIRNPLHSLASFDKVIPSSFIELGLPDLVSVYCELRELGKTPPIIDAVDLQLDPEGTLRGLCKDMGVPFQPAMLKWEAGPKAVDGVFAPWWYKDVHKTTCFLPPKKYPKPFPMEMYDLLEECLPFYNFLKRHAKKTLLLKPSLPLPENTKLLVWVGDEIVPREYAKVSVFDSVVQDGGSVWEGLVVNNGRIFKFDEHLDRLFDSAKALAFSNVPTRDEVKEAIFATLIRNDMFDNVHIRISLTRGKKVTSGTSPDFSLYDCTLIVIPEWRTPIYDNSKGIVLVTATTRRNTPDIEGNEANADDAIILDKDGYVSETNATNMFLVKRGSVMTPHTRIDHCLPGITRSTVMDILVNEGLIVEERLISLSDLHTADEVFTTGTMGEITPVVKIDGCVIGDRSTGVVTQKLQGSFKNLASESGEPIPNYRNH